MSGLFSTFNTGKSGLNVSQSQIGVTSHNISNSNTVGYSRQRAKVVTTPPLSTGNPKMGQQGTGAQIEAVERIRNTFLDYQVRSANASLGSADVRQQMLSQVEDIFGEPSDTGISSKMGHFFDAWSELAKQPNSSNARTIVAQQTLALTGAINSAYTKLEDLERNSQNLLRQNVKDVNSLLDKIQRLNKQIIQVKASGQSPNDLLDSRDTLLDELSYKFGINVENKGLDAIEVKATDKGSMGNATLVTSMGDIGARFSYISSIEEDESNSDIHIITYYKLGDTTSEDNKTTIRVEGLTEQQLKDLKASRVLWASETGNTTRSDGYPIRDGEIINAKELMTFVPKQGEVSGNIVVQEEINEFKNQLNSLAKALAYSINAIQSGMTSVAQSGESVSYDALPFFVNSDIAKYDSNGNVINIDEVLNSESEITAKNITISKEVLSDVMKIKTKTHDNNFLHTSENNVDAEGDGARAAAIASLRNSMLRIQDFGTTIASREDMFRNSKGGATLENFGMNISNDTSGMTFDSFYQDLIDKLGVKASECGTTVSNQETIVNTLESSRDSVSGVSLDEEMANLIQYQHSYNASAKVISTVGELLDVVINGLMK
ncbi:MAG: flagellar hook-associated protein FlgK [Clostridium sp.]|nr:flagellar hook-associated protein FlgK [Clostridium sp.]